MDTRQTYSYRSPRAVGMLIAFLVAVIGIGAIVGIANSPDVWYQSLAKPPFNPPNWVFAPVWFTLYVLIAIAGWRTFLDDSASPRMWVWYLQMLLNWMWSPVWFSLHELWLAFGIIVAMLVSILAFIGVSWRQDRPSALLFVPYALWVAFAGLLNLSVALLN